MNLLSQELNLELMQGRLIMLNQAAMLRYIYLKKYIYRYIYLFIFYIKIYNVPVKVESKSKIDSKNVGYTRPGGDVRVSSLFNY